jgi:hypothetical protein
MSFELQTREKRDKYGSPAENPMIATTTAATIVKFHEETPRSDDSEE